MLVISSQSWSWSTLDSRKSYQWHYAVGKLYREVGYLLRGELLDTIRRIIKVKEKNHRDSFANDFRQNQRTVINFGNNCVDRFWEFHYLPEQSVVVDRLQMRAACKFQLFSRSSELKAIVGDSRQTTFGSLPAKGKLFTSSSEKLKKMETSETRSLKAS